MNKITLLVTMTLGLCSSPYLIAPVGAAPDAAQYSEITAANGFQVSIGANSQEFAWSSPVIVNMSIKNVADKTLFLGFHRGGGPAFRLEVKTKEGEVVPLTRSGKQAQRETSIGGGPIEVAPDESYSSSIVLSQAFDMTIPGEYLVQVSYPVADPEKQVPLTTTSKVLHIKVVR